MGLPRFFRLAKPKTFNYKPVFYDEREEKLKERIEKIKRDMGEEKTEDYKPQIVRGSMRGYLKRSRTANRYSSLRLILIFAILLAIAYYIIVKFFFP
jgi:hypothetical protein